LTTSSGLVNTMNYASESVRNKVLELNVFNVNLKPTLIRTLLVFPESLSSIHGVGLFNRKIPKNIKRQERII